MILLPTTAATACAAVFVEGALKHDWLVVGTAANLQNRVIVARVTG